MFQIREPILKINQPPILTSAQWQSGVITIESMYSIYYSSCMVGPLGRSCAQAFICTLMLDVGVEGK